MSATKLERIQVANPQDHRQSAFRPLHIEKAKGLPIFSRTKVGSCSRVINYKGVRKAIPLYLKTEASEDTRRGYSSLKTTNEDAYHERHRTGACSRYKPLTKFDPNHQRNRLPVIFRPRPESNITFGQHTHPEDIYRSVEHSYIGNFDGFEESSNNMINLIQRRQHKHKYSLIN